MYVCIYVFFNAPKRASCSLSLSIFLFSVRCSLSTQQIIITSRSLPSSVWALGSSSSSTDMPVAVSIALVLSSFICSSFPLAFFFLSSSFFFSKKKLTTILRITRVMIIGKANIAVARAKPVVDIVVVVVDSLLEEEKNAKKIIINNRAVHQHRIIIASWLVRTRVGILFLSVLLLLFLIFLVRERRSSLYIRPSLFSLFAIFSFFFTLIDATYMQNFSSLLLLLVGQAFLFAVASVRSLVRSNSNNKQ